MTRSPLRNLAILLVCAIGCLGAENPIHAQSPDETVTEPQLPQGLNVEFVGQLRQTAEGDLEFTGAVTILWRDSRIQADRIRLSQQRYLVADGNVLVVWAGNRVFGSRMTYDLETEQGAIENAVGQVESDYLFWAERAEKIGADHVRLKKATVTTCTQPVPYWSFSVSSADIRIDHYAKMWNVRLRASKIPVVYLPFLVWPVKEDRAAGLLMPEFHTTVNRGRAVTQELFIPLGRSADLTLMGRYYTEAGFGGGGELRFLPNRRGAAVLNGFYINDEVSGKGRYRATYNQTQQFVNGFRMVADVNLVSDFDYFTDFERELNLVSSPSILARLEFSRNGPWTSMNVRELRREQLFSDGTSLVQQTLPEIEWRGRSRRLGKTPFYLSYESSLASIQQTGVQQGQAIDADYVRGDLFPTISMPISKITWLDVTPRVSYRMTYYNQQQLQVPNAGGGTDTVISDNSITRRLWAGGLDIVGPKFYRVFDRENRPDAKRYKHSIEPRLTYGYAEPYDRTDDIILYDEVDRFSGSGEQMNFGIVQRLFAKRPRALPEAAALDGETVVLPDGTSSEPPVAGQSQSRIDPDAPLDEQQRPEEAVEIASLEFRQSRTFDRDEVLSSADLDLDGVIDSTSKSSPINIIGRYNPSPRTSFDIRGSYDILFDEFSGATLSGSVSGELARVRFSLVHRNGLGVRNVGDSVNPILERIENDTQLRLTTGFSLFRGKLGFDIDGSFDTNPPDGQKHVPDKRWRLKYSTQCCTILVERLSRNFTGLEDRRDFYFRIDLKGIGKLLDVKY